MKEAVAGWALVVEGLETFFVKVSKVVKYEANFAKGVLVMAEKLNTTLTNAQRPHDVSMRYAQQVRLREHRRKLLTHVEGLATTNRVILP